MEKRSDSRIAVSCPVSFSGEDLAGDGKMVNLSMGGWRATVISSTKGIKPGTQLTLLISLPDNPSLLKIDIGVVRWSFGNEFGVEFLDLGTDEAERLNQFISSQESYSPR